METSKGQICTPAPILATFSNISGRPKDIQDLDLVVSEKKIFPCFSYYKPLADNDASLGVASLDHGGMVGRIYKGDY